MSKYFGLIGIIAVLIALAALSCAAQETAVQTAISIITTPVQALTQTTTPPPSTTASTLYPEPSVKPDCLPPEAKWNPYKGEWYNSNLIEIDPITHQYKKVPFTTPPGYILPKFASITGEEWIVQHQDSTDEVDIAIIKYSKALAEDIEKQKQEDPYWMARSSIPTGSEEGGTLTILTDLGISQLQKLLDYTQWENPFVYYLEVATNHISRRTITSGGDGSGDIQVNKWRKDFNDQASGAASTVDGIVQDLTTNQVDERAIEIKFGRLGILALPEVYELVINQGNTDLIPYLPDILPLDKMQTHNIQVGVTDEDTLKQALASCTDDIKIIQTLNAD